MNNGWVKLHRKLLDNPISERPNYIAIWVYLLLKANHKDSHIIWNNKKTLIKKGSFIGSLRKISRYYGISISTVKYIIDYFVSEQMIEHSGNGKFSLFTIKKWDNFQDIEQVAEHKENTDKTQIKTNKNDKNVKNDKNNTSDLKVAGVDDIMNIFYKINPSLNWGNKTTRSACEWLIKKYTLDGATKMAEIATSIQGKPYAPTVTTPYQLKEKLAQIKIYLDKEKTNKNNLIKV